MIYRFCISIHEGNMKGMYNVYVLKCFLKNLLSPPPSTHPQAGACKHGFISILYISSKKYNVGV